MADDEHSEVAAWLQVDPLDDVTRRRLVSTALRQSHPGTSPVTTRTTRTSRAGRWIAAAAAVVVVLVVGLALVTAGSGGDDQQATRDDGVTASPKASGASRGVVDVGDFGDLDQLANRRALRAALETPSNALTTPSAPEAAAGDAASSEPSAADAAPSRVACTEELPAGATVVARGSGTLDGRPATVVLTQRADGSRSIDALLQDPCERRRLRSG